MMNVKVQKINGQNYVDIRDAAAQYGVDIDTMPFVQRVLFENLVRSHYQGRPTSVSSIESLLKKGKKADLDLYVNRVILPDSSGLPVLQDLAALRSEVQRQSGQVSRVETAVAVDLIVDHSLQVDTWGSSTAIGQNLEKEFERNNERYVFLKWAQQAFQDVTIYPPGTGIIHQVNLEHIAQVVAISTFEEQSWAHPDFVLGADSHTTMINGIGVLGWGVGGIDAEFSMLGHAYTFPKSEVVGVRLVGEINAPALITDAVLLITQTLRQENVTSSLVEFFGPGLKTLSGPDRATIANMAPEYGATCGFFPVDENTLSYLLQTGRSQEKVDFIESYCKANSLWLDETSMPQYDRVIEIDLSAVQLSVAGPRRPQDRLDLPKVAEDFFQQFHLDADKLLAESKAQPHKLRDGSIVLAAITSCTNTSNPIVMLMAGLLAKKAVRLGLTVPDWVKTSLAPGSRVVTQYLKDAGLLSYLEKLGFYVIGYGCTTCGGKSGPLIPQVEKKVTDDDLVVAAVLSGNRNFEGRIHKQIKANYIGSPALVVLYALAGRITIDLQNDSLGKDKNNKDVFLADLWPKPQELLEYVQYAYNPKTFNHIYASPSDGESLWKALDTIKGDLYPWSEDSSYLVEPPFFKHKSSNYLQDMATKLKLGRVLGVYGDSLTTDHISPSSEIPIDSPSGEYLLSLGIEQKDFNTYVGRRSNYEVMVRGTFANIRIKNLLLKNTEGGYTFNFIKKKKTSIYEAAKDYSKNGFASIILAGKDYGMGSSRDWAAKGAFLLGIKAVLAKSFERIHRANLVGMGILPLSFQAGEGWEELGLNGDEIYTVLHIKEALDKNDFVEVIAKKDSMEKRFKMKVEVLTEAEKELIKKGGIMQSALNACIEN